MLDVGWTFVSCIPPSFHSSIRDIYMRDKYLCKNLEVKEGGGHGGRFLGTYTNNFYMGLQHVVCPYFHSPLNTLLHHTQLGFVCLWCHIVCTRLPFLPWMYMYASTDTMLLIKHALGYLLLVSSQQSNHSMKVSHSQCFCFLPYLSPATQDHALRLQSHQAQQEWTVPTAY